MLNNIIHFLMKWTLGIDVDREIKMKNINKVYKSKLGYGRSYGYPTPDVQDTSKTGGKE